MIGVANTIAGLYVFNSLNTTKRVECIILWRKLSVLFVNSNF